jgi:hypothetical protein
MEAINNAEAVSAIWFTVVFGFAMLAPLFRRVRK